MKPIYKLVAVVALLALVVSSCSDYKGKSVSLKSDVDSLNYAFGYINGKILKDYHLTNDTTGKGLESLMKGVEEGLKSAEDKDEDVKMADELGTMIGSQLKSNEDFYGDSTLSVDMKFLRQGLINGVKEFEDVMTSEDAMTFFNGTMEKIQEAKMMATYKGNKEAGENFLVENKAKTGVITTETGLQYEVLKAGKGASPVDGQMVKVHYHGTLLDGTVFDSSVDRKSPLEIGVNQVIPGWTEGLKLMTVGSKFKFYIPQELAYGKQNQGAIKPFSMLIFEVELLEIKK